MENIRDRVSIEELYLDHCAKITDKGVTHLSNLTQLRELTLNGCLGLTDLSLDVIGNLTALEYLVIENCPGLTRGRISRLEQALPNCEIVRD